nr:MAG TPA: hypothetical protein [Caudoviricetes sp.]
MATSVCRMVTFGDSLNCWELLKLKQLQHKFLYKN